MLGDRYGYRPIPSFIPEQEFDLIIKEALVFDRQKVETVQSWYIKDSNALPPVYVLQVRPRCFVCIQRVQVSFASCTL